MTARPTKPGDTHPGSHQKMLNLRAALHYLSDDFMPGNERKFWVGQFATYDVKVGSANRASSHPDFHLSNARQGCWHLGFTKSRPRFFKYHRMHGRDRRQ